MKKRNPRSRKKLETIIRLRKTSIARRTKASGETKRISKAMSVIYNEEKNDIDRFIEYSKRVSTLTKR